MPVLGLENRRPFTGLVSSNLTLSANFDPVVPDGGPVLASGLGNMHLLAKKRPLLHVVAGVTAIALLAGCTTPEKMSDVRLGALGIRAGAKGRQHSWHVTPACEVRARVTAERSPLCSDLWPERPNEQMHVLLR